MDRHRRALRVPERDRQPSSRLIGAGPFDDLRVEHDQIAALVVKGDDALVHADHIGRHAHAARAVVGQRLQQVRCRGQVLRRSRLGLLGQKGLVFADVTDHNFDLSFCGRLTPAQRAAPVWRSVTVPSKSVSPPGPDPAGRLSSKEC